jgi:tetratricopeptide (TPR) repeat protein
MKLFSTRETAHILEATEAQVRSYARLGEIVPERGPGRRLEFSFQQLLLLKTTRGLLEAGVPARRVRRIWSSLRRLSLDLPLTGISIFAEGDRAVAWDGNAQWRPDSGQFLLDFDAREPSRRADTDLPRIEPIERDDALAVEEAPARERVAGAGTLTLHVSTARDRVADADATETPALTAEQWFHLGCDLEDDSPLEARCAYEQAIALKPGFADVHLNLGRLLHEAGELGKAEAHYRDAVRHAPEDATAHYNLGVLLEDRDRPDEALHAYEQAIARDPEAADAHYNLGLLLEARHRKEEAMRHLMTARRLYEHRGEPG